MVDLYTKKWRIKFKETFRINIGVPGLPKYTYLRKTETFKKNPIVEGIYALNLTILELTLSIAGIACI